MMSTYELIVAFLLSNSMMPPSTTEATTSGVTRSRSRQADAEANAVNEVEQ